MMNQKQYQNVRMTSNKIRVRKKRKIIRGAMIIILCIITFLSGRATAEANRGLTLPSLQVPEQLISERTKITAERKDDIESETFKNEEQKEVQDQQKEESDFDEWKLILVNKSHPVPNDFSVDLVQLKNGHSFDKRAYPDLQMMMDDARAAGLNPLICSSYRTMEKQTTLYTRQVEKYLEKGYTEEDARAEAGKWVAVPGTSEHQTGLAVDIVSNSYQSLDKQQANTSEQVWLMENCHKYGFILRYPKDKCEITGIGYEPWHYRYVGKEAAAEIMKAGICLEEYLDH